MYCFERRPRVPFLPPLLPVLPRSPPPFHDKSNRIRPSPKPHPQTLRFHSCTPHHFTCTQTSHYTCMANTMETPLDHPTAQETLYPRRKQLPRNPPHTSSLQSDGTPSCNTTSFFLQSFKLFRTHPMGFQETPQHPRLNRTSHQHLDSRI